MKRHYYRFALLFSCAFLTISCNNSTQEIDGEETAVTVNIDSKYISSDYDRKQHGLYNYLNVPSNLSYDFDTLHLTWSGDNNAGYEIRILDEDFNTIKFASYGNLFGSDYRIDINSLNSKDVFVKPAYLRTQYIQVRAGKLDDSLIPSGYLSDWSKPLKITLGDKTFSKVCMRYRKMQTVAYYYIKEYEDVDDIVFATVLDEQVLSFLAIKGSMLGNIRCNLSGEASSVDEALDMVTDLKGYVFGSPIKPYNSIEWLLKRDDIFGGLEEYIDGGWNISIIRTFTYLSNDGQTVFSTSFFKLTLSNETKYARYNFNMPIQETSPEVLRYTTRISNMSKSDFEYCFASSLNILSPSSANMVISMEYPDLINLPLLSD